MILIKKTPVLLEIGELIITLFITLMKKPRKRQKPLAVFKILLENITKALHPKMIRTPIEI